MASRRRIGPFRLVLTGPGQEGFAHDCLVAGDRRTVGFTFYEISDFDTAAKKVEGRVAAVVWMPMPGAQELYRQLGNARPQRATAGDGEIVRVDYTPREGPAGAAPH